MASWVTGVDNVRLKVEFGFDSLPSATIAATTWTDRAVDVRSVTIHRGRGTNFDEYQPGTCTITLDDRARTYDPVYAAGPYFGKLLPMKRVRISMSYAGGAFTPLYNGHVLGFQLQFDRNTSDATTTVNAVDGFYVLQRTILPSLYEYEVRQDDPYIWLRLGDGQAVDEGRAHLNGVSGFLISSGVGPTSGIPFGSSTAVEFQGGDDISISAGAPFPAFPFIVEFWMEAEGKPGVETNCMEPVMITAGLGTGREYHIFFDGVNMYAKALDTTTGYSSTATAPTPAGQGRVHVAATFAGADGTFLYVTPGGNGAGGVDSGTPPTGTNNNTTITIGYNGFILPFDPFAAAWIPPGTLLYPFTGVIDEFAIYDTDAVEVRVEDVHPPAGLYGGPDAPLGTGTGLATEAQVAKVLAMANWPTAMQSIATCQSTTVLGDTHGRTALDMLKQLEKSEQGRFYMGADGFAQFKNRNYPIGLTTPVATFGDSGAELPYSDIGFDYSSTFIRNKVVFSGINGNPYTAIDQDSIDAYLENAENVSGLLNVTDAQINSFAQYRVSNYSQPRLRVTRLEVKPRRAPATLFPLVQTLELTSLVTVVNRPGRPDIGSPISQNVLIEGIEHVIDRDHGWTTTYFLSPTETSRGDGSNFAIVGPATVGLDRVA